MNLQLVENVADAVLYEGYMLYPYRASTVKNRQRFNFGGLYPPTFVRAQAGADACSMQTECLVTTAGRAQLDVRVRFLQLVSREIQRPLPGDSGDSFELVPSIEIDGQLFQSWQEAVERNVEIADVALERIAAEPLRRAFSFPTNRELEPLKDALGAPVAAICRRQEDVVGSVTIAAQELTPELFKLRVTIANESPLDCHVAMPRDEVLLHSLASAHTILSVREGHFVSLLDPPDACRPFAAGCKNVGTWPVLVGEEGQRDAVLSSPIILYDYPQIAPESAGNLFDGTEIDEILTLRIMSLTDEEKREMRSLDDRSREILRRTESLPPEQLRKLHGAVRSLRPFPEVTP